MVDYELFKSILEKRNEGFIDSGDFIDYKLIVLFASHQMDAVKPLFKKSDGYKYRYEKRCSKCGKIEEVIGSKTSLLQYIVSVRQGKDEFLCPKCFDKKEACDSFVRMMNQFENEEKKIKNTEEYIKLYLDPQNSWKKNMKPYQKKDALRHCFIDREKVRDYICSMDYHQFLNTPYWKGIAEYVKHYNNYRCQLCNGTEGLSVHHKTYDNHGEEIYNLKDLVCLCNDCHQKFHGKGDYEQ